MSWRRKYFLFKCWGIGFTLLFWVVWIFMQILPHWARVATMIILSAVIIYNLGLAVRHVWRTWEMMKNGASEDTQTRQDI